MDGFRNRLNAIAQAMPGKPQVSYSMTSQGPNSDIEWTAVVNVGGVEYGSGKGSTQAAAKELAAEIAIANLQS